MIDQGYAGGRSIITGLIDFIEYISKYTEMTVLEDSQDFDWTQFWKNPAHRTSFLEGPLVESYDRAELRWLFDSLLDPLHNGDRLLDVCCGNGAVTGGLLAAADRRSLDIHVDAIDAAEVHPPPGLTDRATFYKCTAERLRFRDATFSVAVACFGLEFCSSDVALREILRVLRPGGQAACLIYADESPMVREYLTFLRAYDRGLGLLIDTVRASIRTECLRTSESEHLQQVEDLRCFFDAEIPQQVLREQLHAIIGSVLSIDRSHSDSDSHSHDHQRDLEALEQLTQDFGLMRAVCAAALPSTAARQLVRVSEFIGFDDCCVIPFKFCGPLLGWLWTGSRP